MGSGAGAVAEAVEAMVARGERVGALVVRLFRPFPVEAFLDAMPASVERVAVLDRTKEPGAAGEPLFEDVVAALHRGSVTGARTGMPLVVGGRYGLSSKEFTPPMVGGVFAELAADQPRHGFTVGIVDDVTHTSLRPDDTVVVARPEGEVRAVFFGLGSDGTVGANKNTVHIVADHTDLHAQGYFVYDSKKSGAMTVSHLRFSPEEIRSTYLVDQADIVACHQFGLLDRVEVLERAAHGATVLLNAPYAPEDVWGHLPREVQEIIVDRDLDLWVIDAYTVARELGLGARINTVMQPVFFALSRILPREQALEAIRDAIRTTYAKRGPEVVASNLEAVDRSLAAVHQVRVPATVDATLRRRRPVPEHAPDFVQRVTARIIAGEGDLLPVSALPVDGTFPTGTAQYEKRSIALDIPIWDPDVCIDCGKCAIVCPHAAIRMKAFDTELVDELPAEFPSKEFKDRQLVGKRLTVQVAPDDCTGCGVCVDVCPATSKERVGHKAIDMEPALEHRERERANFATFLSLPELDRAAVSHGQAQPAAPAPVRVLRRVRGMRRDPVPEAADPAVR